MLRNKSNSRIIFIQKLSHLRLLSQGDYRIPGKRISFSTFSSVNAGLLIG